MVAVAKILLSLILILILSIHMAEAAKEVGPRCSEIGTIGECRIRSKFCRWCRSEALDDMCFELSEALRLPRQVFSCDPTIS